MLSVNENDWLFLSRLFSVLRTSLIINLRALKTHDLSLLKLQVLIRFRGKLEINAINVLLLRKLDLQAQYYKA